jgi:hypothetical protein
MLNFHGEIVPSFTGRTSPIRKDFRPGSAATSVQAVETDCSATLHRFLGAMLAK